MNTHYHIDRNILHVDSDSTPLGMVVFCDLDHLAPKPEIDMYPVLNIWCRQSFANIKKYIYKKKL